MCNQPHYQAGRV